MTDDSHDPPVPDELYDPDDFEARVFSRLMTTPPRLPCGCPLDSHCTGYHMFGERGSCP